MDKATMERIVVEALSGKNGSLQEVKQLKLTKKKFWDNRKYENQKQNLWSGIIKFAVEIAVM